MFFRWICNPIPIINLKLNFLSRKMWWYNSINRSVKLPSWNVGLWSNGDHQRDKIKHFGHQLNQQDSLFLFVGHLYAQFDLTQIEIFWILYSFQQLRLRAVTTPITNWQSFWFSNDEPTLTYLKPIQRFCLLSYFLNRTKRHGIHKLAAAPPSVVLKHWCPSPTWQKTSTSILIKVSGRATRSAAIICCMSWKIPWVCPSQGAPAPRPPLPRARSGCSLSASGRSTW